MPLTLYNVIILTLYIHMWVPHVGACHPQCRYQCDDPICSAVCVPQCHTPVCQVCRNQSGTRQCQSTTSCSVSCAPDQCESDTCPACETTCPNLCNGLTNCEIQCEQMQCGWSCSKPRNCPKPRCVLECEQPACPSSGSMNHPSLMLGIMMTMMTVALLY